MTKKPAAAQVAAKKKDAKSEFLKELINSYEKWTLSGHSEYAQAYERMIFAFTSPQKNSE